MLGNSLIRINDSDKLEWYVGGARMERLIKFLDRLGHRTSIVKQQPIGKKGKKE